MSEGKRKVALVVLFIVAVACFVAFSEWSSEKRARDGEASQATLACSFEPEGTLVLDEESTLRTGRWGALHRRRVTWVDAKTGQRLARVGFGAEQGRFIGCDDHAVWLVSEQGSLEAWSPRGTLLASEAAMLEGARKAGAVPVAPLQLKAAAVHRDGGVMVRGNDARIWRATAEPPDFVPTPKESVAMRGSRIWEARSSVHFDADSKRYELRGDPLDLFYSVSADLKRTEVRVGAPYEHGFIKATTFNELLLPSFSVVVFAQSTLDERGPRDAVRVELDGAAARIVWKQALGAFRVKNGALSSGRLTLLLEPLGDGVYRLTTLDLESGKPGWSYTP